MTDNEIIKAKVRWGMMNNEQQTFDDLLNPAPVHPCEGCKLFVDGRCTYPFSRLDYCISGSKKITTEKNNLKEIQNGKSTY